MPTLPLGHAFTIGSFDPALDQAADACDLSSLRFIDAYGLVGTACALRVALADHPDLPVCAPSSETARDHLTAMGFRDFLSDVERPSLLPAESSFDPSDVVVSLRSAATSGGAQALHHLLWGQLRAHVDPQVLGAVAEGVWEIVANALEHSGKDALIMGQVYRVSRGGRPPDHNDRVQVVVGDVGRGIRASFLETEVHHPDDDLQAINLALQYLVTSVPDDAGRGQGLTTTLEQVLALQGRMVVRSGTAKVSIESDATHEEAVAALPGVIVALSLPLYPG